MRTGFETVILRREGVDYAYVYGEARLRGSYGTPLIFDGTIADCEEWKVMWDVGYPQEWSEKGLERFQELCEASPSCNIDFGHILYRRELEREETS